jgi:predicted regulator of Ras-like GTPase activity (Roadblock/LC7/MglB family)
MSLPSVLDAWPARSLVRGAAVVSEDGLLVHDMLAAPVDGDAVAALAVTVVRVSRQLGESQGDGALRTVVLDLEAGPAILSPIDDRHTLVVYAEPDRDIGPLLFDIRQSRDLLSQAI